MRSTDAQIIAAVSPDPWVAVPLATGMTVHGSPAFNPQIRQWLDMVQLRGRIDGTITSGTVLGTLATQFRPTSTSEVVVATSSGQASVLIGTDGTLTAFPVSASVSFVVLTSYYTLV